MQKIKSLKTKDNYVNVEQRESAPYSQCTRRRFDIWHHAAALGMAYSKRAVQPLFVQSKMRNCAVQKHKNTDKEADLPLSSNVQTLKCCQVVRGFTPWSADQGLCRWTLLGALPPDPVIGSCSALAINVWYGYAYTIWSVSTCAVQNFLQNKPWRSVICSQKICGTRL